MADSLLIIADSEHDANMLYAARLFVPDPFIYLRLHGRDYVVMSDLEIDRARKQAKHCRVLPLTAMVRSAKRTPSDSMSAIQFHGMGLRSNSVLCTVRMRGLWRKSRTIKPAGMVSQSWQCTTS